jgi:arylformamidase
MPPAPSFTSARSRWSPTPALTSTALFTVIPKAKIFQGWIWNLANLEGVVVRHVGAGERELELARFNEVQHVIQIASPTATGRAIARSAIEHLEVAGKAVLFHTGWDLRWRSEDYANGKHPFLTDAAAEYLVQAGAALVGIDSYNIDDTSGGDRPAHSILLAAGIPIVEHLCGLRELPDAVFRFFAVPAKVKGFGTFPVRAFALVET